MTSGLDDFKAVLREFRSAPLWIGAASVSVPFVAAFAGITPSWPRGLEYITAVIQLIVIIVVYQRYAHEERRRVTRNVEILAVSFVVCMILYAFVFSEFTIRVPGSGEQVVIGFSCSEKAHIAYRDACPFLGIDELSKAQYNELALWTKSSVTMVRIGILILWGSLFALLAALVAQFIIFQRRVLVPDLPKDTSRRKGGAP